MESVIPPYPIEPPALPKTLMFLETIKVNPSAYPDAPNKDISKKVENPELSELDKKILFLVKKLPAD
jgi:hypothetical protein